jgi:hypothetical protein
MVWIDLAQDRDQWNVRVNTVMNLRVAWNAGKFLSSCATGGFSRRPQFQEVSSFIKIYAGDIWYTGWAIIGHSF